MILKVVEERSLIRSWIRIRIRIKMSQIPNTDLRADYCELLVYIFIFMFWYSTSTLMY